MTKIAYISVAKSNNKLLRAIELRTAIVLRTITILFRASTRLK